ncbi:MAG: hypothetical protein ACXAD7_28990, partial [Candidatus Kariarchaeaceae archaeon]
QGETDSSGKVTITLSIDETEEIKQFETIMAFIDNEKFESTGHTPQTSESNITITSKIDPQEEVWAIITEFLVQFAIVIVIILIVLLILLYRRRQRKKYERFNQDALSEVHSLSSIRAILMHSLVNQNPFYTERFGLFETDSVLITGLISAISSFLDEIDKEKVKGFQTMERQGLSLTSHNSQISVITFISNEPLNKIIMDQIKRVHEAIDNQFESDIVKATISISSFSPVVIGEIFELSDIKLHLLRGVALDLAKLTELTQNGSNTGSTRTSALLRNFVNMPEATAHQLRIDTLMEYLMTTKMMKPEEAARAIIISYEAGILLPKNIATSDI